MSCQEDIMGYYDMSGQGRGGTQDMLNKLAADKAAANQYNSALAGQRGEVYVAPPDALNNPYGGGAGGYGTGGYSGGGYSGGGPMGAGNGVVTNTGAGGGNINLSRDAYEQQQAMQLKSKLANDALTRITGAMGGVNGGAGSAGGGSAPTVQYGGDAAEAARSAAFARAKEQAGQTANASLKALQDVASRRGIRGSSMEGGMISNAVQGGAGAIQDFTREQMIQDLDHINHVNDITYQGGITQRGQDLGSRQSLLGLISSLSSLY